MVKLLNARQFAVPDVESARQWQNIGMNYRYFVKSQIDDMSYNSAVRKQAQSDSDTEREVSHEQASPES